MQTATAAMPTVSEQKVNEFERRESDVASVAAETTETKATG
jgi:hypothetical protein